MSKVLTTLEEDFKQIGLLPPDHKSEQAPVEESVDGETGDDLTERVKRVAKRFAKGSRKRIRTKKQSAKKKAFNKKYNKSGKAKMLAKRRERKAAHDPKKIRREKALAKWHNAHDKKESVEESTNARIHALIEGVKEISSEIEENDENEFSTTDAVKGFAQVALIADRLAERFADIAEETQDEQFAELSVAMEDLAEEAADSAEGLNTLSESEDEVDLEVVETDFKAMMDAMLEGLDIYAEMTEGDDSEENEEEDDSEEEDEGNDE